MRNDDWKEDIGLKEVLAGYVRNFRQKEILDFVISHYPMYTWSMRTLSCRLQFFEIKYANYNIDVDEIKQDVEIEFQGPGKLLGYRALHQRPEEFSL